LRAIWRDWRDESGVTVLLALFVLTLTTLILGAVYQAVTNDTQGTRLDLDQGRAYAAAQAGIAAYTYQLNQDPNYWRNCLPSGTVAVPNSTDGGSTEYYNYQPIAATTAPLNDQVCDPNNPEGTMIEGFQLATGNVSAQLGTFRIESTGKSNGVVRSVVATFKQPRFLNYVYYTDYEDLDPAVIGPPEPSDCAVHYPPARPSDCTTIQFVGGDVVNGPFHSEDELAIGCPLNGKGPIFGRPGYNDAIETPGVYNTCGSGPLTYTVNNSSGKINTTAQTLSPPSTDSLLQSVAQSNGYVYTGRTTIVLNNTSMAVTNTNPANTGPVGPSVQWPTNGVIYVKTVPNGSPACPAYTPYTANTLYATDTNCGNVYVKGSYTQPLTIGADNDVIINGDITTTEVGGVLGAAPTGRQLLGLVANDFVRVYHQINGTNPGNKGGCSATNTGPVVSNIYAAILAVNHSFIVDNYNCGGPLGNLTIWGAIAQLYRGTVGTSGGSGTGYLKNYNYDDRLAYSEPPYFLNPTSTAWYVVRMVECGTSC
jgi:hypothetical protein